MQLSITIHDTVTPQLERAARECANPQKLLRALGTSFATSAQDAFDDPSMRGSTWAPLRFGGHPILVRSGLLRRSIRVTGCDNQNVTIGTDRPYAIFHQLGTRGPYPIKTRVGSACQALLDEALRRTSCLSKAPRCHEPDFPIRRGHARGVTAAVSNPGQTLHSSRLGSRQVDRLLRRLLSGRFRHGRAALGRRSGTVTAIACNAHAFRSSHSRVPGAVRHDSHSPRVRFRPRVAYTPVGATLPPAQTPCFAPLSRL